MLLDVAQVLLDVSQMLLDVAQMLLSVAVYRPELSIKGQLGCIHSFLVTAILLQHDCIL